MAFADCITGVRGPGQPFRKVVDLRDLRGSRLLRMVDQRAAPWHALRIATPAPIAPDRTQLLVSCCG